MILLDSKIVIFLDDVNDVGKHGIVLRNKIEFIVEYLIMLRCSGSISEHRTDTIKILIY